jgi:hypothetical protein
MYSDIITSLQSYSLTPKMILVESKTKNYKLNLHTIQVQSKYKHQPWKDAKNSRIILNYRQKLELWRHQPEQELSSWLNYKL